MLLRSFKNLRKSMTEKTREDKQGAQTHPLQIVDHSVPAAIGRNMGGLVGGVSNVLEALLEDARSSCSQQAYPKSHPKSHPKSYPKVTPKGHTQSLLLKSDPM
jgi:hypothetical protein